MRISIKMYTERGIIIKKFYEILTPSLKLINYRIPNDMHAILFIAF